MNDFLQTLRTHRSERQRPVMTRRNYDATYSSRVPDQIDEITAERLRGAVEGLNIRLGAFTESQKYLIDARERMADSLERQAIAIERLLNHLNIS